MPVGEHVHFRDCLQSHACIFFHVGAVCDVNLCPESSVRCAPGLALVQATVAGNCCPQYHCGTESYSSRHTRTHTLNHVTASNTFWIYLRSCQDYHLHKLFFEFLPECRCEDSALPLCQVVSQQKSCITVIKLFFYLFFFLYLARSKIKWGYRIKSAICFLSGGGAGRDSRRQQRLWLSSARMPYV